MIAFTVQQGLRPRTPQALRTNCGITCFWWHRKNRPTLELGISFFMVIGKRHKPSSQLQLLSVRVQILTNTIEGSIRYILCWTKHEAPFQPTVSLLFLVVISNFKLVTYLDIYLQILQVVSPSSFSVQTPVLLRLAVLRLALHCNGHSLPSGHGRGMNPSIPVYTCQNGILAIGEYLRYYVNMYCMQYSTH